MALSFAYKVNQATRMDQMDHGMKVAQIEITVGVTGDYSSGVGAPSASIGIDLQAIAQKLGFRKIFACLEANIRSSSTAAPQGFGIAAGQLRGLVPYFDKGTVTTQFGHLRFLKMGTAFGGVALTGHFIDIVTGDILAGDIINITLLGV